MNYLAKSLKGNAFIGILFFDKNLFKLFLLNL